MIDKLARTPLSVVLMVVAGLTVLRLAMYFTVLKPVPVHYRSTSHATWNFINEVCDALIYAGVFVFLVIRPFVLQTFYIPSGSMVQTLQVNDMIIANKFIYRTSDPKHGDIVVFKPPKEALLPTTNPDSDYIKRVIGIPGDVIEIKNNVVYRNGQKLEESYKHFTRRDERYPNDEKYVDLSPEEASVMAFYDFKLVQYKGEIWPVNVAGAGLVNAHGMPVASRFEIADPIEMEKVRNLPAAKIPEGFYFCMGDNRNGSFDSRGWGLVPRRSIIGRAEVILIPFSRIGRIN